MAKLCQIRRIRHLLDQETMCSVVQALVLTRLFYCSSVWAKTTAKNVKKLQLVQNFAARVISNTRKFDHITPILGELKWMTVDQTLVYKDIVQTYKCMSDLSPPYLSEKFYLRSHTTKPLHAIQCTADDHVKIACKAGASIKGDNIYTKYLYESLCGLFTYLKIKCFSVYMQISKPKKTKTTNSQILQTYTGRQVSKRILLYSLEST